MKKAKWITKVHGLNVAVIFMFIWTSFSYKFNDYTLGKAHIFKTCTSNEAAIRQAMKDIESGRKYIFIGSILDIDDEEIKRMEEEEKQYGFIYLSTGCLGAPRCVRVYDQVMRRKINDIAHKYVFRTFDIFTLETVLKRGQNTKG
jgi:hypothetical protein